MRVFKNESLRPFDVDGTLVMHKCPDQNIESVWVKDTIDHNSGIRLWVNRPMVRLLKEEAARGSLVIVWSRGGHQWAANVIEALRLTDYVDIVMTKPMVYFDDKEVTDWLVDRVYISPETNYKG